jgi:hypothetical protein
MRVEGDPVDHEHQQVKTQTKISQAVLVAVTNRREMADVGLLAS